jgi:hypothetical protein
MKFLNNKTLKLFGLSLLSMFIIVSCADLAVENENSPKTEDVLSSPTDLEALIPTGYVQWWQATVGTDVVGVGVGLDIFTSSYGNFDMRNRGEEPRIAYDNSPVAGGGTKAITEDPWYGMYGAISQANDVISALTGDDPLFTEIPSSQTGVSDADYTTMVIASAKFLQGVSLSYIGQFFDQGYLLDENSDPTTIALAPYTDVLALADQKLQDAATLAASLPAGVLFGEGYINGYDNLEMNSDFIELINTQRARIKVLAPRSPSEVAGVDWDAVKSLSADGLSYDFSPEGDDTFWFSYTLLYNNLGNWVRVDQRIISLMDPSQPADYPSDGVAPDSATSDDDRLVSDFVYYDSVPFPPSRGYWFFSNWNTARYDYHSFFTTAEGPMPHILQAENDLMYAEAVIRTTDAVNRQAAVDAINNTRVNRGNLAPITIADSDADILEAIKYERSIELFLSSTITAWGDARRFNTYKPGSIQHYPVPAGELLILLEELYTYGGAKVSPNNPYLAPPKKLDKSIINNFK